jgi:hypothetical protein
MVAAFTGWGTVESFCTNGDEIVFHKEKKNVMACRKMNFRKKIISYSYILSYVKNKSETSNEANPIGLLYFPLSNCNCAKRWK